MYKIRINKLKSAKIASKKFKTLDDIFKQNETRNKCNHQGFIGVGFNSKGEYVVCINCGKIFK